MDSDLRFAVIGRSESEPTLFHLTTTAARAEILRARREETTGAPCFVVSLDAWRVDPLGALRAAEAARFG